MRILVTGGAGFIGSHIVDDLASGGHQVVVVDCLDPAAHGGRPDYLRDDVRYVFGRVEDASIWDGVLRGVEAVCHQASKVGLGVDIADMPAYVSSNDAGTAVLLEALHRSSFRGRFVLASSMVVYGEGAYRCPAHGPVRPGPRTEERLRTGAFEPGCPRCGAGLTPEAIGEDAPPDPRNVYAATKLHQEHLCAAFSRETGVPVTALRYHNVYGPRMPRDTPYAGVASIFRSALAAGEPPMVFEDGRQLRDFVHVSDVARANVLALTADEHVPGAFNVCSGRPRTVGDLAHALAAAFGEGAPASVVTGRYRLGDVRHVFASAERAASVLGFRAAVAFEEGLAGFASAPLRASAPFRAAASRS